MSGCGDWRHACARVQNVSSIYCPDVHGCTLQDVCLLKTKAFGRMLVLDGVIQTTDRDEFSYQEMIVHLALCALPVSCVPCARDSMRL